MQRVFILLFINMYLNGLAQLPIQKMYVHKINTNDGLLQSTVISSLIDANGIMWIGTSVGLQLYDGYHFYAVQGKGSEPLLKSTFLELRKDKNENIWIVYNKGVLKYEIKTGKFINILQFKEDVLTTALIQVLSSTASEYLVIYKEKEGIYKIDKQTNTIHTNAIALENIAYGKEFNTLENSNNKNNYCYIVTNSEKGGGVYQIKIANLSVQKIMEFENGDKAVNVFGDSVITIKRSNHFFDYNFIKKTKSNLFSKHNVLEIEKPIIIWDSTYYKLYDKIQKSYTTIIADESNNTRFTDFGPFDAIYNDSHNNYWINTSGDGLIQINTNALKFNSIIDITKPENNYLRSILWDKESKIIIAALRNKGFNIYDKSGNVVKRCADFIGANLVEKNNNSVMQILKIATGKYVMTNQAYPFLTLLDLGTNSITNISYLLKNKYKKNDAINFYCSTAPINNTTHLFMMNKELYKINSINNKPNLQFIFDLNQTIGGLYYDDHKILIGSNGKFLQIDTMGNILQTITIDGDNNTLIKYFEKDKNNNVWIATTNGLYIWDKVNKVTSIKNLQDHFFYTLVQEKNNNFIWCSSNTGLYRININDKSFTHYTVNDGLLNNEFNTNSCTIDSVGVIYFGSPKGINSIDPTKLLNAQLAPTPTLINITAGNLNIGMDEAINEKHTITLSYTQNNITINFASIDFSVPSENIYRYRFVNKDSIWKEIGNLHSLNFVLEPGQYLFQVQAGKQLSGYNPGYKEIVLIIKPPFYKTWWFITILSFLALLIAFGLGFLIKKHLDRKKLEALKLQFQLQKERERISKDLHDNIGAQATALFYGIENLEKNNGLNNLPNLKNITQDMIDGLRETIWAMAKGNINITALSDRFKLYIKKIGKQYPNIKFVVEENLVQDKTIKAEQGLHLLRIMQEALNNALKHSEAKNIYFKVESKNTIVFEVNDDGNGMDGATKAVFSDGNGIYNMKERASIANFDITFITETNKGTSIKLTSK